MFHGSLSWAVNKTTALFLADEFAKAAKDSLKATTIRIGGRPVPTDLAASPNGVPVMFDGFVVDLRAWLSQCDVYLMPMYHGGGVKTKLVEAMASGLAIVTNSLGAEALTPEGKDCIKVCDTTASMVDAVKELLENDLANMEYRTVARSFAEKHFSWPNLRERYMTILQRETAGVQ